MARRRGSLAERDCRAPPGLEWRLARVVVLADFACPPASRRWPGAPSASRESANRRAGGLGSRHCLPVLVGAPRCRRHGWQLPPLWTVGPGAPHAGRGRMVHPGRVPERRGDGHAEGAGEEPPDQDTFALPQQDDVAPALRLSGSMPRTPDPHQKVLRVIRPILGVVHAQRHHPAVERHNRAEGASPPDPVQCGPLWWRGAFGVGKALHCCQDGGRETGFLQRSAMGRGTSGGSQEQEGELAHAGRVWRRNAGWCSAKVSCPCHPPPAK